MGKRMTENDTMVLDDGGLQQLRKGGSDNVTNGDIGRTKLFRRTKERRLLYGNLKDQFIIVLNL